MATNTVSYPAFISLPNPAGAGDPTLVNPAAITSVAPGQSNGVATGSTIYVQGPNSTRISTSLSVAQVLALLTPTN